MVLLSLSSRWLLLVWIPLFGERDGGLSVRGETESSYHERGNLL